MVSIPATLFPPDHHYRPSLNKPSTKKLIEEVASSPSPVSKVDGSNSNGLTSLGHVHPKGAVMSHENSTSQTPTWTWRQEGGEIRITILVPRLVRTLRSHFTLFLHLTFNRPVLPSHPQPLILNPAASRCLFQTSMRSTLTLNFLTWRPDKCRKVPSCLSEPGTWMLTVHEQSGVLKSNAC